MSIKKRFNYSLYFSIIIIGIYLLTLFLNIKYDPNHIPKNHHDYGVNGFLVFITYTFGWLIFFIGYYQVRNYLYGKDNLHLITFIFSSISGYTLFLLFVCTPIDTVLYSGSFKKGMALFIPSIIVLLLSHTKKFKRVHIESKAQNYENLKKRLGI